MAWGSSSGEHFLASNPPSLKSTRSEFNVKYDYNAAGDGIQLLDATIGNGSNLLNSPSANFQSSDVGKLICVNGAGTAGQALSTTIAGRNSATQLQLTANAGTAVAVLTVPVNSAFTDITTGGVLLHSTTYYYRVTAVASGGGETTASTETSITLGAGVDTRSVKVAWGAVTGAAYYKIYGRTTGAEQYIGSTPFTSFVDTGTLTPSGALPATNGAGASVWYGTNDYQAITNALAAASAAGGGTVYFPDGNYLTNQSIVMKSFVNVLGTGWGSRVVDALGNTILFSFSDVQGITVEQMHFTGAGIQGTNGRAALWMAIGAQYGAYRCRLINNLVDWVGTCGIVVANSTDVVVEGNLIYQTNEHGIYIAGYTDSCSVVSNIVDSAGCNLGVSTVNGIKVSGSSQRLTITANNVIYAKTEGLLYDLGATDSLAIGNTFLSCGARSMRISAGPPACSNIALVGNMCTLSTNEAIRVFDGTDHKIQGNYVYGTIDVTQIQVDAGTNTEISDNHVVGISGAVSPAIVLVAGTNHVIKGNVIGAGATGIQVQAGCTTARIAGNPNFATTPVSDAGTGTKFLEFAKIFMRDNNALFDIKNGSGGTSGLIVDLGQNAYALGSGSGGSNTTKIGNVNAPVILGATTTLLNDLKRSRQTPTEAVLVSGVDATAGELVGVTLTAARLVGAPLNPAIGQRLTFTLIQGGAGAFAVTWNAVFKKTWADTGNATGARSTISYVYDGTNWNQDGAQAPYV